MRQSRDPFLNRAFGVVWVRRNSNWTAVQRKTTCFSGVNVSLKQKLDIYISGKNGSEAFFGVRP